MLSKRNDVSETLIGMVIPVENRSPEKLIPDVTNEMKARCIGEFSWKEEDPYFDESGNLHERLAIRTVPWDLCKEIYKTMASIASKGISLDD